MTEKLNQHQIERIMFLLHEYLDNRIHKNQQEINKRREELLKTINTEIKQELYKTNQTVLDSIIILFDKANELNEQGICNDVAARISQHQFWAWQLKASFEWGWG